jgi:hypothetical protein
MKQINSILIKLQAQQEKAKETEKFPFEKM